MPIFVDSGMPPQHLDMLSMLAPNPVIKIANGEQVSVDRLWVAPTTTFRTLALLSDNDVPTYQKGALSPRFLKFFQSRITENVPESTEDVPKRIYLDRGHNSYRSLRNESEILKVMIEEDVIPIQMAKLSFVEQVQLMRRVEWIVGPSGSSFNNMIFASPKTKILVFHSQSYDWATGLGPLRELGYKPLFIGEKNMLNSQGAKHRSYQIDPTRVRRMLKKFRGKKHGFFKLRVQKPW